LKKASILVSSKQNCQRIGELPAAVDLKGQVELLGLGIGKKCWNFMKLRGLLRQSRESGKF
jgi:hypothetical protein